MDKWKSVQYPAFYTLQEERSVLTGAQIVLLWLSMGTFIWLCFIQKIVTKVENKFHGEAL